VHAFAEEQVLYPAWAEAGMTGADEEARAEHADMKEQIVLLDRHEPGQPEFEQALSKLIADVRHHVSEEEGEELPAFRQQVGAEKMHEFFGASAVLDKAEQAQQEAAGLLRRAFGSGGQAGGQAAPTSAAGTGTVIAPASTTTKVTRL
jgi:hypothetical protein